MYQGNQLAKIHIGKKHMGLTDDEYRAFLMGCTGKSSAKDLTTAQRARVIYEMTRRGAFKRAKKPLTGVQKACVAKWYKLRSLGAVNSKDKASLNRFVKANFSKWNVADLTVEQSNKLAGMLEGWIKKTEHTAGQDERVIQAGR